MTIFQLKQLASNSVHAAADAIGWDYDRAELIADGIVGLRRQSCPGDAAGGKGLEHRKAAAARQPVDQRGDEHRFTGPRQAGNAEPHRRVEEMLAIVHERPGRQARLLDHILETESHGEREGLVAAGRIGKLD